MLSVQRGGGTREGAACLQSNRCQKQAPCALRCSRRADASPAAWSRQGELRRVLDSVRCAEAAPSRSPPLQAARLTQPCRASPQEKPRDPIDLRGRLDSKGVRYGKVIDFKCAAARCARAKARCTLSWVASR